MQIFSINWNERWSLVCVFFSFSFGYIYFFFAMVVVVFVFVIVVVYPYYLFLHFRFLQHFHYFCLEFVLDWVAASFSINNIQSRAHRYLCILYMNIYIYICVCEKKWALVCIIEWNCLVTIYTQMGCSNKIQGLGGIKSEFS